MAGSQWGSGVRIWLASLALACFGAGVTVGIAVPELMAAEDRENGTDFYVRGLVDKYGLTVEQERMLRMVLREDERAELAILKNIDWGQLPVEQRNQRLLAKRRTEQRIRFVLDERQRALYDRDSRPTNSVPRPATDKDEQNR